MQEPLELPAGGSELPTKLEVSDCGTSAHPWPDLVEECNEDLDQDVRKRPALELLHVDDRDWGSLIAELPSNDVKQRRLPCAATTDKKMVPPCAQGVFQSWPELDEACDRLPSVGLISASCLRERLA